VYEADHTGGLGRVALKMLALSDQDTDDVRRFYREAQVTAQLRHANTVRVFDVGQVEGGALFIAMELLTGRSLEDELRAVNADKRVLTQAQTIAIACDVLKSLSEAHGKGLVHRDLEPANLMLTEVDGDQVVKVLDFGIAHVQDSSLTGTGRALGTPMYMSPEQCSGGVLDARSDLYALGVIVYRCVAGKAPFSDPNPLTLMFAHASQPPPDLFATARTPVSEPFVACVMRSLAKDPAERFANARDMRQALEEAGKAPVAEMPAHAAETGDYAARKPLTPAELAASVRRATGISPRLVVTSDLGQLPADATGGLTLDARPVTAMPTLAVPQLAAAAVQLEQPRTEPAPPGQLRQGPAPKWPMALVVGGVIALVAALAVVFGGGRGADPRTDNASPAAPAVLEPTAPPTAVPAAAPPAPTAVAPAIGDAAAPAAPDVAPAQPSAATAEPEPPGVAANPPAQPDVSAPPPVPAAPAAAAAAPKPRAAEKSKSGPKADKPKAPKPGKIDSSLPED